MAEPKRGGFYVNGERYSAEGERIPCEHKDVRAHKHEERRTAVACFDCGRLFGWLYHADDTFVAHNPPRRSLAAALDESREPAGEGS